MSEYIIKVSGGKSVELPFANANEEELIVVAFKEGKSSVCESFSVAENTLTIDCDCDCFYVILDKKASCEIGNTSTSEINADAIIEQFKADNEILKQLQTMQNRTLRGCDEIGYLPESEKRKKTFLSFDENGNPVCEVGVDEFDDAVNRAETACRFAEASEESAENAKTGAEEAKVYAEQAQYGAEEAYTNTQSIANKAIENIETAKTGAVNEIESKVEEAKGYAESAKAEAEKESKVRDEISNIVNTGKAEIQESISNAKEEIDNWSDQSSRFAQNESDIAKLFTNKTNNSVLHCNGGYAIANNVDYPEVFSVAFRSDWDFVDMSKKFTPLKLGMSGTYGLNFYSLSSDGRLRLYVYTASVSNVAIASYKYSDIATNLNAGLNSFVLAITKDADGDFLPKFYVNGNLIENFVTTKVPAFTMGSGEFKLNSYSASNITAGNIAYQDVCVFNFDISAENAPYTLADYQTGKSIPPSLKRGYFSIPTTLANNSWTVVPDALSTATSTTATYDVDTKTFTWTATAQATTFFRWWLKYPIKAGSKIKVSFGNLTGTASPRSVRILYVDDTYDVSSQTNNPSIAPQMVSNTTIELSPTKDVQALTFDVYFSTAGDTLSVSDLEIEVVGATLALEDYTIGGKILDYSGNKNHATITGSVAGDYDTNVEAFVETITTLTSEQN